MAEAKIEKAGKSPEEEGENEIKGEWIQEREFLQILRQLPYLKVLLDKFLF